MATGVGLAQISIAQLNPRTALTRRAILNTCKMWRFLFTHVVLL